MLVLHAGFRDEHLLVWAESSDVPQTSARGRHPHDAGPEAIGSALAELEVAHRQEFDDPEIWLPSLRSRPVPSSPLIGPVPAVASPKLRPWTVTAVPLEPDAGIDLLSASADKQLLRPGLLAGTDLAFWSVALRFAASLAAHGQFLPDLLNEDGRFLARWRSACVGRNDERRRALLRSMPAAARAFTPDIPEASIVNGFVDTALDRIVRTSFSGRRWAGEGLHERWLAALHSADGVFRGDAAELRQLQAQIRSWRRPVSASATAPFRLCFRLEEPASDEDQTWRVHYLLQSRNDPSLIVPAETAWQKSDKSPLWKHAGFRPREHLLLSLGQASAVCPRIEESLNSPAPDGYSLDSAGAHDFLSTKAAALEEAGFGVMLPAWWTRKGTRVRLSAGAHIKSPFGSGGGLSMNALLEFNWQISLGEAPVTEAELRALAALKQPLVKFRGQWVQLNAQEIQAALEFWKKKGDGRIAAREAVRMALGASSLPGPLAFSGVSAEGWFGDLISQLEGHVPFEQLEQPAGLNATLRPYQLRGYSWLAFVRKWGLGACLADDMGLGKTIQTLSLIMRDRAESNEGPVLLVCPTSVVGNWQKEAERFTPGMPVLIHHGAARTKGASFVEAASKQAIVISSYALLHRDLEYLNEVPWSGIILDEAQNIRNSETRQATAARALKAGYRIALTGTPVENNVGDLWSIMEFLNPGLLGARSEFRQKFFVPIQTARDPEATARLKKITGPFVLRRLKTDKSIISDLPEKVEGKVFCTLTKEQASLYAAIVKDSMKALESADGIKRKGLVLATLMRLKQICNHPAQYLADNSPLPGRSGKLARLTEMIEEALSVQDRVLVFSQFSEMGAMLQRHLQDNFGQEVLFLHGAVPKKQRDRMVERFETEPEGPPIFVLSLKAGGTGLNLTRANHVFHFDRWWNPAVENQATDRAFRIGQKKNVQVHKYVCAGTLEESIDSLIESKREIASGVVGTGEGWLTELSTDQLRDMFSLRESAVAD